MNAQPIWNGNQPEPVIAADWDIGITRHDVAAELRELAERFPPKENVRFVRSVDAATEKEMTMSGTETPQHDQPWGTEARGQVDPKQMRGAGVGGASVAGTPAGPARENAEAETSGLQPPVGMPYPKQAKSGSPAEPPHGPGAFTEDATPPPVYDV